MSELLATVGGKLPKRVIDHIGTIPSFVTYEAEGVVDFGDTGDSGGFVFATPAAKRGVVYSVELYDNGETFAGTTSSARVDIGDGTDADEFATCTIADGTAAQTFNLADGTLTQGDTPVIAPGDQVTVTCVDATGSPTGQAKVAVTMLYFT